jgi:tetratricopeptide (TPR) repeat protein
MKEANEDMSSMRIDLRMKQAKRSLMEYLAKSRRLLLSGLPVENYANATEAENERQAQLSAMDYALVRLYLSEQKYAELKNLLKSENGCILTDVSQVLQNNARYLAVLYFSKGEYDMALDTLRKLGEGGLTEETDRSAKGISETIELLCEINQHYLVFKYAPWVFEADDLSAIKIFTSKLRTSELPPADVINFLLDYPPDLEREYLEFLVATGNTEERFHTRLVMNYIEVIVRLKASNYLPFGVRVDAGTENGLLGEIRAKLMDVVQNGTHFNPHAVLAVISKTNLYEETLILYRKLGLHEQALKLLIWKIEDLEWAERYCIDCYTEEMSIPGLEDLNPLFLSLLKICLEPEDPYPKNETFAMHILTKQAKAFNPVASLALLHDDTSIARAKDFIRQIVQSSKNRYRQSMVVYNMCNIQFTQNQAMYAKGLSRRITVTGNTLCPVCDKNIDASSVFVVMPDLTAVHFKCSNKERINVHPVTGTNFARFPVNFDEQISDDIILAPPSYAV